MTPQLTRIHVRPEMESLRPFNAEFEAIVRAHYERLAVFAYRMLHDRDEAEDAVQEVLLRMWQRRDETVPEDPVSYLYTGVRNQAVMRLRRVQRWRGPSDDDALEHIAVEMDTIEASELGEALNQAVQQLPTKTRLVYSMSREQNMTYPAIALALGISVKTVESQMARALRILRTRLAPFLVTAAVTIMGAP